MRLLRYLLIDLKIFQVVLFDFNSMVLFLYQLATIKSVSQLGVLSTQK